MRILSGSNVDRYKSITHLILDEVHEREQNTDFFLIVVRDIIRKYPHLRLILMSATLDAAHFSTYFDDCPIINVPGRMFDVDVIYLDRLLVQTRYETEAMKNYLTRNRSSNALSDIEVQRITLTAYQTTKNPKEEVVDHNLVLHIVEHIHTQYQSDESILVFLPGYNDIIYQKRLLDERFRNNGLNNYRLFMLHSNVEEANVFNRMPNGTRKIILSTNIAETSVTINDVVSRNDVLFKECIASFLFPKHFTGTRRRYGQS